MLWAVIIRDAIRHDAVGLQRGKGVAEAAGNPKLIACFGGQGDRQPSAKGWRFVAQIHRHVENRAGSTAYELSLNRRGCLEVNSANRSSVHTERLVFLNEFDIANIGTESVEPKNFGEIAAIVCVSPCSQTICAAAG